MAGSRNRNPTAIDYFCGAGGFSEGFRQAGFEIVAGYDSWKEARETFRHNFPMATIGGELTNGGWVQHQEQFGKVDVIIGGPPCTEFSSSNKWGNGDTTEGLKHVQLFFDYVDYLRPRHWLMENVPRLEGILSREIENGNLTTPKGYGGLPFMVVLNSEDFGVPQRRKRLFTSDLDLRSLESARSDNARTLGGVIDSLKMKGDIKDYNYPNWKRTRKRDLVDYEELLEYVKLNAIQKRRCEDLKQFHGFAGKITFPDELDKPSRTVMATQTFSSRETIVLNDGKKGDYRSLTVRENACLQGFPIDFQFYSDYTSNKYRLVGNAVPVGLARAIANEVRSELGRGKIESAVPGDFIVQPAKRLQPKRRFRTKMGRGFHWHPSGSRIGPCRVDLDNREPPEKGFPHECRWTAILHVGIGRHRHRREIPGTREIWKALRLAELEKETEEDLLKFVGALHGNLPDATTLLWSHINPTPWSWEKTDGIIRPRFLIEEIDRGCENALGSTDLRVDCGDYVEICPDDGLPLATLGRLFALHWACVEINECMGWAYHNRHDVKWGRRKALLEKTVKRGGCRGVKSKRFPRG